MLLIIDFGSQTTHLIGRRLRQLGILVEYADGENAAAVMKKLKKAGNMPMGIILSGGPASVYEKGAPTMDRAVLASGMPILGICYGWQLMAKILGGKVESAHHEYGPELLTHQENIFKLSKTKHTVFMSHGDSVTKLPLGFRAFASTRQVKNAAVVHKNNRYFGVQFHPEVDHSEYGLEMLRYFAEKICGEKISEFQLDPKEIISRIKDRVGDKKVLCAVSGGVDSTVAAFLIGKAIGKNLLPIYVDSGLMREGTTERVRHIFTKLIKADLVVVEAKSRFMKALKGVTDPEQKRKAIGKLYIKIFQEEARKHPEAGFLGQGTIYSDVIESKGSKKASNIKSHHNVGGLPEELQLQLLEPIRDLYKDEVRELGRMLGLPEEMVMQQPFPGPGFAIRIRGEVTPERLQQAKAADTIILEEMKRAGLYDRVFQCFPVLTGAYSTAVKGDARVFAEVVALRAYESRDVMTSRWADIPYEVLQTISSRIVNEVPKVSRVVYDITTKPPATMEWE